MANFTAGVISIITASTWSSAVGKSAMAATAGLIGKAAVQGTVVTAPQAATAGAIAGAATGAVGAIGGLGGTWLGIRVPQWMAPTMTERKLLEREGRFIWRLSLGFVFALLVSVAVALLFATLPNVVMYIVLGNMLMAICFAAVCIIRGMGLNQQIKHIRQTINPDEDPNPTWIKDRMGLRRNRAKQNGLVVDRQVSDEYSVGPSTTFKFPIQLYRKMHQLNSMLVVGSLLEIKQQGS